MKKIIGNLLYDTEKAEKIYSYRLRRKTGSIGTFNFYSWFDIDVYKTKKITILSTDVQAMSINILLNLLSKNSVNLNLKKF